MSKPMTVVCLLALFTAAQGQDADQSRLNEHYAPHFRATLGLVVGPVSGPWAAHAPVFEGRPGYGLVILHVAPDSSAAKAGLMKNDILVAFGNQILYSTHQYAELLDRVRPGQKVKLQVVHPGDLGKVTTIDTTMGWAELMNPSVSVPNTFNPLGTAAGLSTGGSGPQIWVPPGGYIYPPARYWRTPGYPDDPSQYEPPTYESIGRWFDKN